MLTFDESAHAYYWNGERVPGVTSILGPLVDFRGVPLAVLEAKADLGRRVHLATELDDVDDLDESSVESDVSPYLEAWRRFKREKRVEIEAVERKVYHPTYRYAGALDRVLRFDGARFLADIKTSVEVAATAGPQTAAYLQANGDHSISRRAAIQLRPDGSYRVRELNDPQDWPVFLSCLTINNFKAKHNDD